MSRQKKVCSKGHTFYKSSDCPTCPVCATAEKPEEGLLSLLSAPARRALQTAGIGTLTALARHTQKEVLQLHGMGPASLPVLKKALEAAGLSFRES